MITEKDKQRIYPKKSICNTICRIDYEYPFFIDLWKEIAKAIKEKGGQFVVMNKEDFRSYTKSVFMKARQRDLIKLQLKSRKNVSKKA